MTSDMEKIDKLMLTQDVRELKNHYYENAAAQLPHPPMHGSIQLAAQAAAAAEERAIRKVRKPSNMRNKQNRLQHFASTKSRQAIDQMSKIDNFKSFLFLSGAESQESVPKSGDSPP